MPTIFDVVKAQQQAYQRSAPTDEDREVPRQNGGWLPPAPPMFEDVVAQREAMKAQNWREQMMREQEEEDREERELRRRERAVARRKLDLQIAKMEQSELGGGGGGASPADQALLRQLEEQHKLIVEMQRQQREAQEKAQNDRVVAAINDLQKSVAQTQTSTLSPLEQLRETMGLLATVRAEYEKAAPPQTAAAAPATEIVDPILQQQMLLEFQLRSLDSQAKIAEIQGNREAAASAAALGRYRVEAMANTVRDGLDRFLPLLVGQKVSGMLEARGVGGAAAAGAAAAVPQQLPWTCPSCQTPNQAAQDARWATCGRCGNSFQLEPIEQTGGTGGAGGAGASPSPTLPAAPPFGPQGQDPNNIIDLRSSAPNPFGPAVQQDRVLGPDEILLPNGSVYKMGS